MDFDLKIIDNDLTIYCSNALRSFAEEFKVYYKNNIKKIKDFFNIVEEVNIIVALTDKVEEAGFVYGVSSFSGFFNDTGAFAYINLNGDRTKEYMFKGLIHELVHHLYKFYVYGEMKNRITWVDEGLAQFLSGQKDDLQEDALYHDFLKENIEGYTQININELNHDDRSFGNKNGYNLSYISIRYLYENYDREKFIEIIKDEKRLLEIGSTVINEIYNFYNINV